MLRGPEEEIAPISAVTTAPIDITNLSRSVRFRDVPLRIPRNLEADPPNVLVAVEVRPALTTITLEIPLPEGVRPSAARVTVEGPAPRLRFLRPEDLTVSLEKTDGRAKVQVQVPPPFRVVLVDPEIVDLP